ncbi:hypothetical protein [Bacillus gaemokensis]|uniref:Uncharacterized protein n=1 Tax=Bacillus gaemokensis TaxID=574375 RepID=A0A073K552_9BACI|nr:hypothetical protein [Bacillus gaemokensis]KEK21577.1 hypothetical protein BAGA_28745 [Bacillus gaemokensis]KYG33183.1 hypothetical protein AZF08_27180 [Bacillus gaemokensis]
MFNKKKGLGVLLAAGIFATSIGVPTSSYAATPSNTTYVQNQVDFVSPEEQKTVDAMVKYVKFDKGMNQLYIENKDELKVQVDEKYFNELETTVSKVNNVINTKQGVQLRRDALRELRGNSPVTRITGCGAATLAGFAHTTAFGGLMTVAGVSGPAGWAIGAGVGAVWLGAQAAAGCL